MSTNQSYGTAEWKKGGTDFAFRLRWSGKMEWRKSMRLVCTFVLIVMGGIVSYGQKTIPADVDGLLKKYLCVTCHKLDEKLIGPSYIELAKKGQSVKEVAQLIVEPKPANWPGYPPMAPMPHLPKEDVQKIAKWIVSLRE